MLPIVTFDVGYAWCSGYVGWLCVKGCAQEEGEYRLSPSSTEVAGCVRDEVDLCYCFVIITYGSG